MAKAVATMTRAAGTVTVTGNFTANDEVTVGTVTYKFVASPSAANDVDIGTDAETSLDNLTAAINGSGTEGTTYGTDTVQPADITASNTATVLTVTADTPGTHGNNYILTEVTDGGGTFSVTAAFTGGAGDLQTYLTGLRTGNQLNSEAIADVNYLTLAAD